MKKNLIIVLTLVLALVVGQTAFAATSAFSDVPAKHWAYGALNKLVKDGVIEGYGDGTFRGDKTLSRYEMAIVVARTLTKVDKASAEDKALIEKLSTEFHSELDSLNARMDTVEKKVDALTYHGDVRVRLDKQYFDNNLTNTPANHVNLDVFWGYQVNDRWAIKGESEYNRQLSTGMTNQGVANTVSGTQGALENSVAEQLYATGPLGGTTIKVGRFSTYTPYGLVYDDKIAGAEVSFGKVLNVKVQGGQADSEGTGDSDQNYAAILFAAPLNKTSNVQAGFVRVYGDFSNGTFPAFGAYGGPTAAAYHGSINYYTFSYDTKLGADWSFAAAYAKSNADTKTSTSAWLAKVQYKAIDLNVPGTYDIYAEYRKSPWAAQYSNTDDWIINSKGTRIGFDYTLDKNITFLSWYTFGKYVNDNSKANMFRTQLDFHF